MYSRHLKKQWGQKFPDPTQFIELSRFFRRKQIQNFRLNDMRSRAARDWLSKCTNTLEKNIQKMVAYQNFPVLFHFCNKIKFHQRKFYDMAEIGLTPKKLQKMHDLDLLHVYGAFVNFRHEDNKKLKANIRNYLLQNRGQWHQFNNFFGGCRFIELICLDSQLSKSQKQILIKMVVSKYRKPSKKQKRSNQNYDTSFAKLYEMIKVYDLNIDADFMKILQESNSKVWSLPNDLDKKRQIQNIVLKTSQNRHQKRFQSIFELMFQDFLKKNGYNYESNVFYGVNQYDILIKGYQRIKHRPLQNFDLDNVDQQIKQFPLQKLKIIASSSDPQWIQADLPFQEKVLIDLHGPNHYIESDDPKINNTILMSEQFRYLKLPLYGIHNYNLVYYKEWQQKNKYPALTTKFVQQIIANAKKLPKISV